MIITDTDGISERQNKSYYYTLWKELAIGFGEKDAKKAIVKFQDSNRQGLPSLCAISGWTRYRWGSELKGSK